MNTRNHKHITRLRERNGTSAIDLGKCRITGVGRRFADGEPSFIRCRRGLMCRCLNFRLAPPTFQCSGCEWAKYCSRECQRADWVRKRGHREECNKA